LRQYPTNEVLGFLVGVRDSTTSRMLARVVPVLEVAGKDTMRMPDSGRKRRKHMPACARIRPSWRSSSTRLSNASNAVKPVPKPTAIYSGKNKQHTLKSQLAIDEQTSTICDVPNSVPGLTADVTLLTHAHLLERLPDGVGGLATWPTLALPHCTPLGWVRRHAASRVARRDHRKTLPQHGLCQTTGHG
jgi:hypothetical protein